MKKLFFSALVMIAVATSAFAAGETKVNYFVKNSFESQFRDASNVEWTAGTDYLKATFVQNKQRMEAFYNESGELIGTSTTANLDELPVNAKRAFAKKFDGYTVKQAIRFEGADENAYYISAENEKGTYIIKLNDNGVISVKKA